MDRRRDHNGCPLIGRRSRCELGLQHDRQGLRARLNRRRSDEMGRDPFLISYGIADGGNRCIVTTEVSKPSRNRGNHHVPDVCDGYKVPWCDTFEFIRALNFSTGWRS